jgi:hypothetical protein
MSGTNTIRAVALLAATLSGCSLNFGSLTAASTKNVGLPANVLKRGVEGTDCIHNVLGIPMGSLNPNIQEATDRALQTVPDANALTDAVVYAEPLIFLLYNRTCIRVRGDAVKISQPAQGVR